MNINKAERLARSLMDEHGLTDWKFKFDNAKKRFGLCKYGTKTLSLSLYLVAMNGEEEVEETIRHEIGHALAGPSAGHGPVWKRTALSVGSTAKVTYDSNLVASPDGRWQAWCPVHGVLRGGRYYHRRLKNRVCARCRTPVEWRERK